MEMVSPLGPVARQAGALAPRPRDLRGCRVAVLDNSKPNAGVLLQRVADLLAERAGARPAGHWRKPGSARPADDLDAIAAAADVVLTGSAD